MTTATITTITIVEENGLNVHIDNDLPVAVQVNEPPAINVSVAEVIAVGPSPIHVGDTAPDPDIQSLWVDTT